jgi:hypothetical protein
MKYLNTPGNPPLYSGVTTTTPLAFVSVSWNGAKLAGFSA